MKLITKSLVLVICLALLVCGASAQQSLGEAARKARKNKPAPSPAQRVYTNDNLPSGGSMSVVSGSGVNTPGVQDTKSKDTPKTKDEAARSGEELKKEQDEWRAKFADQKNKIQLLERELAVLQREYQIRVAVFYADAGVRLRDDKKFADADRQYKADIETRQRELDSAKQRLEDMREEARKAGMPASVGD
jgi:hypothetical protein